ncbi:hypothetical protein CORC01_07432 [Colletotrichum orchidophilum]|uniref:Uncharacterized protein n=1 Tax=Colletotrichum orchidophilum TaxID=1209926 RepID=A0A1G4B6V1_9PEZI|nr:uncharacterized protein CORC01_07432 [Colletotrichum orchidophilum]OHE97178.1 hypothetical protein CORC01_07432 [Colletotrichum orchidophilum]
MIPFQWASDPEALHEHDRRVVRLGVMPGIQLIASARGRICTSDSFLRTAGKASQVNTSLYWSDTERKTSFDWVP